MCHDKSCKYGFVLVCSTTQGGLQVLWETFVKMDRACTQPISNSLHTVSDVHYVSFISRLSVELKFQEYHPN